MRRGISTLDIIECATGVTWEVCERRCSSGVGGEESHLISQSTQFAWDIHVGAMQIYNVCGLSIGTLLTIHVRE